MVTLQNVTSQQFPAQPFSIVILCKVYLHLLDPEAHVVDEIDPKTPQEDSTRRWADRR